MPTKQLDPIALSSLLHGTLLCAFGTMHEAAEWVAGYPIFTHQFTYKPVMAHIREEILRQFPDMDPSKPRDWQARLAEVRTQFGELVDVEQGNGQQPNLEDGLPERFRA